MAQNDRDHELTRKLLTALGRVSHSPKLTLGASLEEAVDAAVEILENPSEYFWADEPCLGCPADNY